MMFGVGMVVGNLVGGKMADISVVEGALRLDHRPRRVLALFVLAVHNPWTALLGLFLIGASGSAIGPALQTRLMDVAHGAQTLAAALNHSALNIANAAGAWIGGLVIAAGYGYTAPAGAGALLAVAGLRRPDHLGTAATLDGALPCRLTAVGTSTFTCSGSASPSRCARGAALPGSPVDGAAAVAGSVGSVCVSLEP